MSHGNPNTAPKYVISCPVWAARAFCSFPAGLDIFEKYYQKIPDIEQSNSSSFTVYHLSGLAVIIIIPAGLSILPAPAQFVALLARYLSKHSLFSRDLLRIPAETTNLLFRSLRKMW